MTFIPPIEIFNKRSRQLGTGGREDLYIQVHLSMKSYLKYFKGAKWAVMTALSLHMDGDGWTFPSISTIAEITGYNEDTVVEAIKSLEELIIDGQKVLLKVKAKSEEQQFQNNLYLIFPSAEDVVKYEGKTVRVKRVKRSAVNSETGEGEKAVSENPGTEKPDTNNNHVLNNINTNKYPISSDIPVSSSKPVEDKPKGKTLPSRPTAFADLKGWYTTVLREIEAAEKQKLPPPIYESGKPASKNGFIPMVYKDLYLGNNSPYQLDFAMLGKFRRLCGSEWKAFYFLWNHYNPKNTIDTDPINWLLSVLNREMKEKPENFKVVEATNAPTAPESEIAKEMRLREKKIKLSVWLDKPEKHTPNEIQALCEEIVAEDPDFTKVPAYAIAKEKYYK